uniref:Uncharacterized protein n=1 Tax=Ciona intestinalis TaxID=7719 RepID=H2Y1U6_CIOIN
MLNDTTTPQSLVNATILSTTVEYSTAVTQKPFNNTGVYVVVIFLAIIAAFIFAWYATLVCNRARSGIRTYRLRRGYNKRISEADAEDFENPIYFRSPTYSSAAI